MPPSFGILSPIGSQAELAGVMTEMLMGSLIGDGATFHIVTTEQRREEKKIVFEDYKDTDEKDWGRLTNVSCKICQETDAVVQCVLHPCGHACACRECAKKLLSRKDECPFCRTVVTEVTKYRKQILVTDDDDDEEEKQEQKGSKRGGERKRTRRNPK